VLEPLRNTLDPQRARARSAARGAETVPLVGPSDTDARKPRAVAALLLVRVSPRFVDPQRLLG
jgi:hypothetical protein